jgi:UDP-glucose 4-epimerase
MEIFLTGGAGFIGSWLAAKYLHAGHSVTVFDNFSSGLMENLEGLKGGTIRIAQGDIRDYAALKKAMEGHDFVCHQAAQLEITTSIETPEKDAEINIIGSMNVLRSMKELGIRSAVFASSACVYGNIGTYAAAEDHSLMPNWEYGVSKLAVEKYCDIYCTYEGLNVASLRYSIVYGEHEWYGRVLTSFLKRATQGRNLIVFGDGIVVRDFIHVEDVADLCMRLTQAPLSGHLVLNVSSGLALTINELAERVRKVVKEVDGVDLEIEHENIAEGEVSHSIEGRARLPRELRIMSLDNAKAAKITGWKPAIDLDQGLDREYRWIKANPGRWTKMSY